MRLLVAILAGATFFMTQIAATPQTPQRLVTDVKTMAQWHGPDGWDADFGLQGFTENGEVTAAPQLVFTEAGFPNAMLHFFVGSDAHCYAVELTTSLGTKDKEKKGDPYIVILDDKPVRGGDQIDWVVPLLTKSDAADIGETFDSYTVALMCSNDVTGYRFSNFYHYPLRA